MSSNLAGIGDDLWAAAQKYGQQAINSPGVQQAIVDAKNAVTGFVGQQVAANIKQVTFYSAYSPPVAYTGDQLAKMVPRESGPTWTPKGVPTPVVGVVNQVAEAVRPKTLMERVKPTIVVETTKYGNKVYAPYGMAAPEEHKTNIPILVGGVLALLGVFVAGGYYLGYRAGQRSR